MCVALLIASEFMPVSLLTPMAHDLGATEGMAVITSLLVATVAGRFDRRHVLTALTAATTTSLWWQPSLAAARCCCWHPSR